MTEIIAAVQFLIQLKDILQKLGTVVQQQELKNWVSKLEGTVDAIQNAKTTQQKLDAAHSLVSLIGGL